MARENKDTEFQVVTIRVPKNMYSEYKEILQKEGKIVTYDVRNDMQSVVEKNKEGEK
ncbi:transcriptional regulator [Enterococcus lactis]|uniref:transcriptional regulator n=1 Tax=Enterococcus lactis TaxID=357441 RepID=UPI0022E30975|nr:transcriptional regulator [Enterococcus lactis]